MNGSFPDALARISGFSAGLVLVGLGLGAWPASAGNAPLPPPPGAVYWLAGERNFDDSASFYNGTAVGAIFIAGKVGEAIRFDGIDDRVAPDAPVPEQRALRTAFSYELWARPSATLPACPQSNNSNCFGMNWAVFPNHGEVGAPPGESGQGAGIGIAIGTNAICVGEHAPFLIDCLARADGLTLADWTHVAVVVENKTPRIYVNGALAQTGVASAKQFVFASWTAIGSGLGLGNYTGDLDELTLYGRALTAPEIMNLFLAGAAGKVKPACQVELTNDLWQGATVTNNTPLLSTDATGMFGGLNATPEPTATLFQDSQPDGTVHAIEWQTALPVRLTGFAVFGRHASLADTSRAFRSLKLQAAPLGQNFEIVFQGQVVVPYAAASAELRRCPNVRPLLAQKFRAEFTQDGPAGMSGPRVLELDGLGSPDLVFSDGFETNP